MLIIGILFCTGIIGLLYVRWGKSSPRLFILALIIKLFSGFFIGYLYSTYYDHGGDTYAFFKASVEWSGIARENPKQYIQTLLGFEQLKFNITELLAGRYDRSLPLVKFLSLVNLLSGDNYWVAACICSLIAFAASWFLYQTLVFHFKINHPAFFVSLFLWPSMALWTSGLTKDSLAFACLCVLFAVLLKLYFNEQTKWYTLLLALIALWLLWLLKYYYAALFMVFFLPILIIRISLNKYCLSKQLLVYGIMVIVLPVFLSALHPNLILVRLPEVIVENYQAFALISTPGGYVHYSSLEASWISIFLNAPKALLAGLIFPLSPEEGNTLRWLVLFENYFFMILLLTAVLQIQKLFHIDYALLIIAVIAHALVLSAFLALSSPNYGTLIRFKIGFMPFLLILVLSASPVFNKLLKFITRRFSFLAS